MSRREVSTSNLACRICMKNIDSCKTGMCSESPKINDSLAYVLKGHLTEQYIHASDYLPKWFCQECVTELNTTMEFLKKATSSYHTLLDGELSVAAKKSQKIQTARDAFKHKLIQMTGVKRAAPPPPTKFQSQKMDNLVSLLTCCGELFENVKKLNFHRATSCPLHKNKPPVVIDTQKYTNYQKALSDLKVKTAPVNIAKFSSKNRPTLATSSSTQKQTKFKVDSQHQFEPRIKCVVQPSKETPVQEPLEIKEELVIKIEPIAAEDIKTEPESDYSDLFPNFDAPPPPKITKFEPTKLSSFACKICEKKFSSVVYLNQHITTHGRFICKTCYEPFDDTKLFDKHMATHRVIQFSCGACPKKYLSRQALHVHNMTTHAKKIIKYACKPCGIVYSDKVFFHEHMVAEHSHPKIKDEPAEEYQDPEYLDS